MSFFGAMRAIRSRRQKAAKPAMPFKTLASDPQSL